MKKKTFYILLAVWGVALVTLVAVLVGNIIDKNVDTPTKPPITSEGPSVPSDLPEEPEDPDDKNWTSNY